MTMPEEFDYQDFKVPPHSVGAEQSTLGGLMLDRNSWDLVSKIVKERDFYREDHRLIFRSIQALAEDNKEFDWITLGDWLENNGELKNAGGNAYLGTLAKDTPSAANIKAYAGIVKEKSILRDLIATGKDIQEQALGSNGDSAIELAEEANQRLADLVRQNAVIEVNYSSAKQMSKQVAAHWEKQSQAGYEDNPLLGISTGFVELDRITQGYCNSDLIIVAGRPAMGKSAFALKAEKEATKAGNTTAEFNMEMPDMQIAMRFISSLSGIPLSKIRNTKDMREDDWSRVIGAGVKPFSLLPFFVNDTATQTLDDIKATANAIAEASLKEIGEGLGMIVVDYLQLITTKGGNGANRNVEVGNNSRGLKTLAKDMGIPVIALSQLSRTVDSRSDKRPVISDLRESGQVEQDADLIIFPFREGVYNAEADQNVGEIIVAKNRNGESKSIPVGWNGATVNWFDMDDSYFEGRA